MSPAPAVPAAQRELFAKIVEQHRDLVCGVAYSTIGNRAQSEELAQEAFLTAWRKLPELEAPEKLPAFLCGIARNLALNARRKSLREVSTDAADTVAGTQPTPFEDLASEQSKQFVREALETLPDNYREALVLFYRSGKSVDEVAAALGVSQAAAKQLLSRGRKRLRAHVTEVLEKALVATKPAAAFTAAVMVVFDAAGVAHAATPALSTAVTTTARASAKTGMSAKAVLAVAGGAVVLLVGAAVHFTGDASGNQVRVNESAAARHNATPGEGGTPALERGAVDGNGGTRTRGGLAAAPAFDQREQPRLDTGSNPAGSGQGGLLSDEDTRARLQRKVDLDFGEANIYNVIRLISEVAEVDIVTKGDISAMVNMRMRDTPSLDALDEALMQAGAKREEIPIIRVVAGEPESARLFRGKPVTARFENASMQEVAEALTAFSDVPIVVSKTVESSPITVSFEGTPFASALQQALSQAGAGVETGFAFEVSPDTSPGEGEED